jgi:DUF971 family protein
VRASIARATQGFRQPKVLLGPGGARTRRSPSGGLGRLVQNSRVERPLDPGAYAPTRIHADRAAGTLELEWQDGHRTVYNAHDLRWLCPCAFCRGEAGLPGWLDTSPTLTSEQTRLVDVHLVGSYAIAPTWGDGHHTGYYPFRLLRDRCSCAECASARRVHAAAHPGRGSRPEEVPS